MTWLHGILKIFPLKTCIESHKFSKPSKKGLQDFQQVACEDVDDLFSLCHSLLSRVGTSPAPKLLGMDKDDCSTVWEAITILNSKVSDALQVHSLTSSMQTELSSVITHLATMTTTRQTIQRDFNNLNLVMDQLKEFTQLLTTKQQSFVQALQHFHSKGSSHSPSPTGALSIPLHTLQAHLDLIEACLPNNPFIIGGRSFNSKADVALFVTDYLSGISFSLFHDVVTLLQSVCADHVLKSDVMTEWYHAGRVGLNEEEVTHVASFKLTIPTHLGVSKDARVVNTKYPLPGVKSFESWDPQDNISGKAKYIHDGINDVDLSIRSTIETVCASSLPAKSLALDMLTASKLFVENLST